MTKLKYELHPLLLSSSIGQQWRDRNIIWLDMQIDTVDSNRLRFDFDIAFNPISERRGGITRKDYYIGSTGAEIQIEFQNGNIVDHSKEKILNVDYKVSKTFTRNSDLVFKPSIKVKGKGEFDLGELKYHKSDEINILASFKGEERTLASVVHKKGIRWNISLPRTQNVVRDYIIGNLYLFIIVARNKLPNKGSINVKPSDVLFFGPNKTPLGSRKSWLMKVYLKRKGKVPYNQDGFQIHFKELTNE
tara:strand:- start:1081 stop:1821 length:741 start_codon:yes stop_codon:yes gene_type:complete